MLTRAQKEEIVNELADKIKHQQSLIFTDVTGVSVAEIQDLRRKLKEQEIEYKVGKKNLIDLALKKEKQDLDTSQFTGTLALAFAYKDPISSIKILHDFAKEHKNLRILGGIMENKVLAIEEIQELAKIPSKDELLTIFVNSLRAPISGFINALQGNIRNLVGILKVISSPR
jgi:large subunit ribosomal protein L10